MKQIASTLLLTAAVSLGPQPAAAESFNAFLKTLKAEALAAGRKASTVKAATRGLKPNLKIIPLTTRQPEFLSYVGTYLSKRVTKSRIKAGRRKVRGLKKTFTAIEKRFGVDPYIVAAIWGLETNYGGYIGKSDIFRATATLAWKRYRGDFFKEQFLDALYLMESEGLPRRQFVGSWASGMGQTQFIPSSYRNFAVDMDGDGKRNLWRSTADALGSTANYLVKHGWVRGQPWGHSVRLPDVMSRTVLTKPWTEWAAKGVVRRDGGKLPAEGTATLFFPAGHEGPAFLVTANYSAIRDYNWSDSYVLSVARLAAHLRGKPPPKLTWPKRRPLLKPQRVKIQKLLVEKGFRVPNRIGRITADMRKVIRDYQISIGVTADGHPDAELLKQLAR
ncbi:MAG: lytic murein transglycosylase [Pseudomonadota bacterium]